MTLRRGVRTTARTSPLRRCPGERGPAAAADHLDEDQFSVGRWIAVNNDEPGRAAGWLELEAKLLLHGDEDAAAVDRRAAAASVSGGLQPGEADFEIESARETGSIDDRPSRKQRQPRGERADSLAAAENGAADFRHRRRSVTGRPYLLLVSCAPQ